MHGYRHSFAASLPTSLIDDKTNKMSRVMVMVSNDTLNNISVMSRSVL